MLLAALSLSSLSWLASAAPAVTAASAQRLLPAPHRLELAAGTGTTDATCVPDEVTLCLLGGQVQLRLRWRNHRADDQQGEGRAVPLSDRTGTFWFFREDNTEVVVKALDGRANNGHFWIFFGALSDVEFLLEATAVETGETVSYFNPPGHLFGLADTRALDGDGGLICAGFRGIPCPDGLFCDLQGGCGVADAQGVCVEITDVCPEIFDPVCGCDGTTYGNDCERQRAQVVKDHDGPCEGGGG